MGRETKKLPKVVNLRLFGCLYLASQILLLANGADQPPAQREPEPLDLLKMVAQARQRVTSGEMELEVASYETVRPLDGTNRLRLKVLFDGQKLRFESFGREYACLLMGPDAVKVTDAKREELGLDREASVLAGLLSGVDSHRVTAYDGKVQMEYPRARAMALMDPKEGSGSFIFDPRVLGLTTSPSVRNTVENRLTRVLRLLAY
jgi:hypothetical protein